MARFPWRDFAPALAALVGLGVVWGLARGVLDEVAATMVNAVAATAVSVVIAWSAWRSWRHVAKRAEGVELEGELRTALMDRVRSRWIGTRDASGWLTGDGRLATDLTLGTELDIFVERRSTNRAGGPAFVFEAWRRSGHAMVLTGDPGAGKTVQLLLLAERLLDEAERDPTSGVPIILSLASWRPIKGPSGAPEGGKRPFEDWLVTEIHARYRVPKENSRRWLVQGRLIPILDGLDEALPDRRSNLFTQLRAWISDAGRPPAAWALGRREQEYAALDPNHNLIGGRSEFWSMKSIGEEERLRFLRMAATRLHPDWQKVVSAIESGNAPHLTTNDGGERGVLATPLGLAIAVEAYRPNDVNEHSSPTELLNSVEDWDRLWTRYVTHRYHATHRDPDSEAAETKQPYSLDDACRWLGTLGSVEFSTFGEVDLADIEPPERQSPWSDVWTDVQYDPIETVFSGWLIWLATFALFGALVGWRDWGGVAGFAIVAAAGLACVLAVVIAGSVGQPEAESTQVFAVIALSGIPGLLVIGAGMSWPGEPLIQWIQPTVSRLEGLGLRIGEFELRIGDIQLNGWGAGAVTGLAIATMYATLLALAYVCSLLYGVIIMYRRRDISYRPAYPNDLFEKYFWWLDYGDDDLEDIYGRWVARYVLLRWWYYGSPVWSRSRTGLVPHPRDWDRFVSWATYRGYLRRVGDQHVWMHETLRQWFVQHLDIEALRRLQGTAG